MLDLKKIGQEIQDFWDREKVYEELIQRPGKKFFILDGPPYANNIPHVGHIKNTVFKDLVLRRAFMKGNNVLFQPGFDTHGLPIENMVENKLGLTSKKDIESYGIEKFMQECKNNAALYKDVWMKVYKSLGSLYTKKEPYLTYNNSYVQSAWWAFSQMHKKGLVYEGEKPVMWCPHCQTSLSGYEVTDSYKEVTDPGVYVLFKLADEDSNLLVYTTTPWTLPANVAVAVAPEEFYVKVEINGKKIILGEKRLTKLSELEFGYTIIDKFKGSELIGKKYTPLLDVPLQRELSEGKLGKAHEVIASIALLKERVASKIKSKKGVKGEDLFEEFVTLNEGTGMVHTAPGHGKTDNLIGQHYGLACVSPVDDACNLTPESGFSGFVKKADKEIIQRLDESGHLLAHEKITHNYPLCWRCKSPLIFRLSEQLFLRVEDVKRETKIENEKVDWMPEFARDRFENWIENAEDWNISRQRYWGIPIPLWRCECGKEKVFESKEELEKAAGEKIDDLHTAGTIKLRCECGKEMSKFKGILDVWFDSGVAPWASMGYPFTNKELFEEHFPVDRINEAQDQIRSWFYSLMFCSVATFGKAPYKSVSMTGWVLDKKGDKMSKSQGNFIGGEEAINELGADILRYYFCWDIAPYEIQKFNLENAKKEVGGFLNVLWNLQNLISSEKIKGIEFDKLEIEEKWIISRMNNVLKNSEGNMERFELHTALREISDFLLNDLSRTYIQMTREKDNTEIVFYCLDHLIRLLAPVSPFITEKIWQNLKLKGFVIEKSVHHSKLPFADDDKINHKLENQFSTIKKLIELGLAERDKAKIGLRWPLAKAKLTAKEELSEEMLNLIAKQLNVKKVELTLSDKEEVILDVNVTPELEAEGYVREFLRQIQSARKEMGLKKGQLVGIKLTCDKNLEQYIQGSIELIKQRANLSNLEFSQSINSDRISSGKIKDKAFSFSFD